MDFDRHSHSLKRNSKLPWKKERKKEKESAVGFAKPNFITIIASLALRCNARLPDASNIDYSGANILTRSISEPLVPSLVLYENQILSRKEKKRRFHSVGQKSTVAAMQ